jgi:hypothetical protein
VSPLWRHEVAISLAPRNLALVRRTRGLRPRVVAATEVAVATGTTGDIGPVLARLADLLTDATWHGAAARVVVADHLWARYGIVPRPATRLDVDGRLAQARFLLGDAYGEAVADWAVTLADAPPGRSYLACAIPATLRSALEDTLAPARLELVSLLPQLVAAFNAWRRRLPADDAWFVNVDHGSLSAVHLSQGSWDRVHMTRPSPDWSVELERLRALGTLTRTAGAPARMFVAAPARPSRGAPASEGIEWLEEGPGKGAPAQESAPAERVRTRQRPRPVRLDFVASVHQAPLAGAALCVVGLAAALWVGVAFDRQLTERSRLEAALGATAPAARQRAPTPESLKSAAESATVERALGIPWTRLLAELEAASHDCADRVSLLMVEPDPGKHLVQITAEVRGMPDALTYLKRLQKSEVLRYPMLESHERRKDDPQHPLRIRVSAEWRT